MCEPKVADAYSASAIDLDLIETEVHALESLAVLLAQSEGLCEGQQMAFYGVATLAGAIRSKISEMGERYSALATANRGSVVTLATGAPTT